MTYLVLAIIDEENTEDRGLYDTLDEARGCVEFDGLNCYEIWRGDELVESSDGAPADFENRSYAAGYAYACGYQD